MGRKKGLELIEIVNIALVIKSLLSYADDTENMQEHVHKIIIEGRLFAEALSELHFMNISRASLFPDPEGFGTSLAHKLEHKSSDEIETLR